MALPFTYDPVTGTLQPSSVVDPGTSLIDGQVPGANQAIPNDPEQDQIMQEQIQQSADMSGQAAAEANRRDEEQKKAAEQRAADLAKAQKARVDSVMADVKAGLANPAEVLTKGIGAVGEAIRGEPAPELAQEDPFQEAENIAQEAALSSDPQIRAMQQAQQANAQIAGVQSAEEEDILEANVRGIEEEEAALEAFQLDAGEKRRALQDKFQDLQGRMERLAEERAEVPKPGTMNLIGVFLNGLIAPYQGGRNLALETVMKRMQQEIDVDSENRRRQFKALSMEAGAVQDELALVDKGINVDRMIMAQKLSGLKQALVLKAQAPHISAKKRAELDRMNADIGVEIGKIHKINAKEALAAQLQAEKLRMQQAQLEAKKSRGRGARRSAEVIPEDRVTSLLKAKGLNPEKSTDRELIGNVQVVIDGKKGFGFVGVQPSVMKSFNEKAFASERNFDQMSELAKLIQEPGLAKDTPIGKTEQAARIQSRYGKLLVDLKEQFRLGAISGPDAALMEMIIGKDPADLLNLTPRAALASLEELYNASRDDMRAAVRSASLGEAQYQPRLSWKSLTKPIGKGRRATDKESVLAVDKLSTKFAAGGEEAEAARDEAAEFIRTASPGGKTAKSLQNILKDIPRSQREVSTVDDKGRLVFTDLLDMVTERAGKEEAKDRVRSEKQKAEEVLRKAREAARKRSRFSR